MLTSLETPALRLSENIQWLCHNCGLGTTAMGLSLLASLIMILWIACDEL